MSNYSFGSKKQVSEFQSDSPISPKPREVVMPDVTDDKLIVVTVSGDAVVDAGNSAQYIAKDQDNNTLDNSELTWWNTGGGLVDSTGLYTAPTYNPNCKNNPTIHARWTSPRDRFIKKRGSLGITVTSSNILIESFPCNSFATYATGETALKGLTSLPNGNFALAQRVESGSYDTQRIVVFTSQGLLLENIPVGKAQVNTVNNGDIVFGSTPARGLAYDASDNTWWFSTGNSSYQINDTKYSVPAGLINMSYTGYPIRHIDTYALASGNLSSPAVTVDNDTNSLWLVEAGGVGGDTTKKVYNLSKGGTILSSFTLPGPPASELQAGISMKSDGTLYIVTKIDGIGGRTFYNTQTDGTVISSMDVTDLLNNTYRDDIAYIATDSKDDSVWAVTGDSLSLTPTSTTMMLHFSEGICTV